MRIKGKIPKIIGRSAVCLFLSVSIIFSSISISFAYSEGSLTTADSLIDSTPTRIPIGNQFYGPTVTRNLLGNLYDGTYRIATMIRYPYIVQNSSGNYTAYGLITILSYNELLVVLQDNVSLGISCGIYSRTPHDMISYTSYSESGGSGTYTYYTGTVDYGNIGGFDGPWYRNSDSALMNLFSSSDVRNGTVYCNGVFACYDESFLAVENLDISAYLPDPYYFSVARSDPYIICECNFNPREWDSFVTVWGYNEYGGLLYIYGKDEYQYIQYDIHDGQEIWSWSLELDAIFNAYLGTELHISSISLMGWYDGTERTISVDWNFNKEPAFQGDYDPPNDNYYYTTYYNETYHYAEQNGNVVAFGNVDICLYSDQTLDRVFWDKQKTLLTPYPFSYCFVPSLLFQPNQWGDTYYNLLDELCLEFDVVITNVPEAVFDAMYGQGAFNDFHSLVSNGGRVRWFYSQFRYYDLIPYEYFDNLPTENYTSYDCCALYSNSFYFKSLAYLFGDNNERLLEFESRLVGEDGAFQELFTALKKIYKNDFDYYTQMTEYMSRLDYLVRLIVYNDYFQKYLDELQFQSGLLEQIDSKISQIAEAITDVGGEDYDNDLGEPWLTFYRFFKSVFVGSLGMLDDFRNTVSVFIDSNSDAVGLDFELDNDYQQYLPLIPNSNNPTPTPIPIPTLFP